MINQFWNSLKEKVFSLLKKWGNLFYILIDPYVLILAILIVAFYIISKEQKDTMIIFILTLGITLLSGLLGGMLAKKWDELTESKIINTRGQSAARSLYLLLKRSIALEIRVFQYLKRFTSNEQPEEITREVLITYFEEIINTCVSLEENIANSIEDWSDIVPEAGIQSKINSIMKLKEEVISRENQLEQVTLELKSTKETSTAKITELEKEKENLSNEIQAYRRKVVFETTSSGINNLSGSLVTGGTINSNPTFIFNPYTSEPAKFPSGITVFESTNAKISPAPVALHQPKKKKGGK